MLGRILIKGLREGLGRVIVLGNYISRPKPMQRSAEGQKAVDLQVQDLALYQFHACPFCVKTRRSIHRLNLPIQLRDAQKSSFREELEQGGGRVKVPCLRIREQGSERWLYESGDIIKYLDNRFSEVA